MPTVSPPAKVLVSGANGFIAVWVIQTLLEKGYAVRGTVRSLEKGKYLKTLFEKYSDKFELVVVADITKVSGFCLPISASITAYHQEGAFDEAVKGVDAIEHTASPFHFNADDPEGYIPSLFSV
jgi:nucleoside-diphosphate-sugar epimerase